MRKIRLENSEEIYYIFTEEEVIDIQSEIRLTIDTGLIDGLAELTGRNGYNGIEEINFQLLHLLHDNLPVKILHEK